MKKITITAICAISLCILGACCTAQYSDKFIHVESGQFIRNGKPYKYIGTNFWYGPLLAIEGEQGDRERLHRELDSMQSIGVDNLRILVGADGAHGVKYKIEPTLQVSPGEYNDKVMAGLDYLMAELSRRDMVAVLYLNNSWEWSGGYYQYLEWAGYEKAPVPLENGWDEYMNYVKQFHYSPEAKSIFKEYVKHIVSRTNRYTNVKYADDPTIMAWQIGNEPRAFGDDTKELFAEWMAQTSALIKSLDKNHMVSTGNEGLYGCEQDISLFETIHSDNNIDYINIHIWPYNWRWVTIDNIETGVDIAKKQTLKYIDSHMDVVHKLNKPLVIEEFGYPRNEGLFTKESHTSAKDEYYKYVLSLITDDYNPLLAACNFWAWGGDATIFEDHNFWRPGDDYTGDPAQEPQGLYSVFVGDTTVKVIREANNKLNQNENNN